MCLNENKFIEFSVDQFELNDFETKLFDQLEFRSMVLH